MLLHNANKEVRLAAVFPRPTLLENLQAFEAFEPRDMQRSLPRENRREDEGGLPEDEG